MTAPKQGDRVHVEFDAIYAHAGLAFAPGSHVVEFPLGDDPEYWASVPAGATLTVLPPDWKVGDTVERDDLGSLPIGAVVVPVDRIFAVGSKGREGWSLANSGYTHTVPHTPAVIVALRGGNL